MKNIVSKISEGLQLNEARKSDTAAKPFETKEELMAFVDEVEKTKLIVKKYEDEAQKYWDEMAKNQRKADKEFNSLKLKYGDPEWHEKYDEIQKKYQIDELMEKASKITEAPECKEANKKLYGELQQRALDSLSPKEQKAIGKRGGRMYNILAEVFKKYTHWDYKKNKPVE
jgi:hypothetical protein